MTVVCPIGHPSATTDWCDQCGRAIVSIAPPAQPTEILPVVDDDDTSPATRHQPCPVCRASRSGDDRFCEQCGHDFAGPAPAPSTTMRPPPSPTTAPAEAPTSWEAVASADRGQFERLGVEGISFPAKYQERCFGLSGPKVRIGKSRELGAGEHGPEIDLAGDPEDPGVSRRHAVLELQEDGTYSLRDDGSTNGTTVNDSPDRVGTDEAVPLADGDRIRVGAWTTITVRSR